MAKQFPGWPGSTKEYEKKQLLEKILATLEELLERDKKRDTVVKPKRTRSK
jgi:hypothetical protein